MTVVLVQLCVRGCVFLSTQLLTILCSLFYVFLGYFWPHSLNRKYVSFRDNLGGDGPLYDSSGKLKAGRQLHHHLTVLFVSRLIESALVS